MAIRDKEPVEGWRGLEALAGVVMQTKLRVLVEALEAVKAADASAKCLVFTQFKQTQDWLAQELPKRGFNFRSLSGDMSQAKVSFSF